MALIAVLTLFAALWLPMPALGAKKGPDKVVPAKTIRALKALEALEPRSLRLWPGSFGGLWLERGKVFIAFTERGRQRVELLAGRFPSPKRLHAVRVDDSLKALKALQSRMMADRQVNPVMSTDPASGRPIPLSYALDIDVKRNVVVAISHQRVTQEMIAAFGQRYGEDVVVEFGPPPEPAGLLVCSGRESCPPNLRAGLKTQTATGASCTTAFNVTYSSSNGAVDGVLSAAHCGDPVDDGGPDPDYLGDRFHAGAMYGEVVAEQQSGRVDAELHSVVGLFENVAPWSALAPWIYVSDATKRAPVTKVGTYDGLPIGATVCKSGITKATTCGEVLSKTYSFDGYVSNAVDFIKTDYCTDHGDSGGPVYSTFFPYIKIAQKAEISLISRKAQGINSGLAKDTPCSDPSYYALFGHIEFVQDALPVTITKASP